MNFKITHKNARDWNALNLRIYESTKSKILLWICWKIEQIRTPRGYYDDRLDEQYF